MPTSQFLDTAIFKKIINEELVSTLISIRDLADTVSAQAANIIPEFTDHSVRHMDELLRLTEVALTKDEIDKVTEAEAFVLVASYYLHDLGMTAPALPCVARRLRELEGMNASEGKVNAKMIRDHHAELCSMLLTEKIETLGRYVIESTSIRDVFAESIASVCRSHGWNISKLDDNFGYLGITSIGAYGQIDLGFAACILRIVDYMDLSANRAPKLLFRVRDVADSTSKLHWLSQMNISSPMRERDFLKYTSFRPIEEMDAWWLAWDLISGLSSEIESVRRYLDGRVSSQSRFSLISVIDSGTPELFSTQVRVEPGLLPIDVRVSASSMDSVVSMLGGDKIYGNDKLAPVRELIQNSRDAVYARSQADNEFKLSDATILVKYNSGYLTVSDNGIGMSASVITDHLLSLASSYWNSQDAKDEYGLVFDDHAGRFGIGFISVFMMAEQVKVSTNRLKRSQLQLVLEGIERRGQLRTITNKTSSGTEVELKLDRRKVPNEDDRCTLRELVLSRAPMLPVSVKINDSENNLESIEPFWWCDTDWDTLLKFLSNRVMHSSWKSLNSEYQRELHFRRSHSQKVHWEFGAPSLNNKTGAFAVNDDSQFVLLCSYGLAVKNVSIPNISGMVEVGEMDLTVSRNESSFSQNWREDPASFFTWLSELSPELKSSVIEFKESFRDKLEELSNAKSISACQATIDYSYNLFGYDILRNLKLPWIPLHSSPGNLIHVTSDEIVNELESCSTIALAVGERVPSRIVEAAHLLPSFQNGAKKIISLTTSSLEIGYRKKEDIEKEHGKAISGTVSELEHILEKQFVFDTGLPAYINQLVGSSMADRSSLLDMNVVVLTGRSVENSSYILEIPV